MCASSKQHGSVYQWPAQGRVSGGGVWGEIRRRNEERGFTFSHAPPHFLVHTSPTFGFGSKFQSTIASRVQFWSLQILTLTLCDSVRIVFFSWKTCHDCIPYERKQSDKNAQELETNAKAIAAVVQLSTVIVPISVNLELMIMYIFTEI